jgi:hypothetical protein
MNKKTLAIVAVIVTVVILGPIWLVVFTNFGLGLVGAMKETLPSVGYAVEASGNNLRAYEWDAKNGMKCVGVYSKAGGSWGNCAFPPK